MFKLLLKKQLTELSQSYFPQKRKKGKEDAKAGRSKGLLVLFIFLYAIIGIGLGAMMLPICRAFVPMGLSWMYFLMAAIMGLMIGVVGSVFSAYSAIYRAGDNEFLLALPIKPLELLISRMAGVYIVGLFFTALALVPCFVVYFIVNGFSFKVLLGCLVGLLSISLIVNALTCFFGWIVALCSNVTRNRAVTTVLASLLLIALYYFVYFKISDFIQYVIQNAMTIGDNISSNARALVWVGEGFTGDLRGIGIVLLAGVLLSAISTVILLKGYNRILTYNKGMKRTVYVSKAEKQNSALGALIKREFTHFSQSPAYMLNDGLGILILLVGIVYLMIKFSAATELIDKLNGILQQNFPEGSYDWVINLIHIAPALITCFIAATAPVSAPSISIEGQTMWLLRCLPVKENSVFLSKQLAHIILLMPVALIATIVLSLAVKLSAVGWIVNIVFTISFVCFTSALGLALGLAKPNLSWTNETEAVKQGAPVAITLLGGMALPLILGLLTYLLRNVLNIAPFLWIVPLTGAVLLNLWIFKHGAEKFRLLG